MKIRKLLENMENYLSRRADAPQVQCDRIDELLEKLAKKEIKLKKNLDKEKDAKKRKRLKTELKIIAIQRRKGTERRGELKKKCK